MGGTNANPERGQRRERAEVCRLIAAIEVLDAVKRFSGDETCAESRCEESRLTRAGAPLSITHFKECAEKFIRTARPLGF